MKNEYSEALTMNTIATTLRVGLIGNPVAHSYSPRLQQAALDALDIPARYELWQTNPEELSARVASLLLPASLGANVTIPYKEAVLPFMDVVDPLAASIGAVNTVVHRDEYLYGYNTDAPGLLHALAEQGVGQKLDNNHISFAGYTAIVLGAGGAARGAAFALVSAGVERLIIVNRTLERTQRLATAVQQDSNCQVFCLNDPEFLIPHPSSLIINATPLGMHVAGEHTNNENASPLSADILARFASDTLVYDMIYHPTQTQLLCQARILGLRAVNGLSMLLHQGALAFTLWTGEPAPLEVMRATLF
jgi:shikimate dehydrogenase